MEHRSLTLGEVLDGDRMAVSMYNVSFKESFERKTLCTIELKEEDIAMLKHAIEDLYYFEFVYGKSLLLWQLSSPRVTFFLYCMPACNVDDVPIRGFIGHLEEGSFLPHNHKTFLWTHLHFSFEHNGDQVRLRIGAMVSGSYGMMLSGMVLSGMMLSGMVLSGMVLSGMMLSGMVLSGMMLSGMVLS